MSIFACAVILNSFKDPFNKTKISHRIYGYSSPFMPTNIFPLNRMAEKKKPLYIMWQNNYPILMPIIKSAKKRVRSSAKKHKANLAYRTAYKSAVKKARIEKSEENVKAAYRALDKAAQKRVIHPNKAARLKSRIGKK